MVGLSGCEADSDGGSGSPGSGPGGGGSTGGTPVTDNGGTPGDPTDDNGGFGPNDGTTPSPVFTDTNGDGTISTDEQIPGNFVCDYTVPAGTTTDDGSGGLVGGPVSDLLGSLGGGSLTTLTNSVVDSELAIDTLLATYSTFTMTAAGLATLNEVAQDFYMGSLIPSGDYAVFGVRFPSGTVEASLVNTLVITTYRGTDAQGNPVQQEQATVNITAIDLLGTGVTGEDALFVGIRTTKPYDYAQLAQGSQIISANVGESMYVHEMCTRGHFVAAP